jgi:O-antigen/teichoic acid export membrane protein
MAGADDIERETTRETSLRRKVAGQGVLLFAGFGLAQGCSFARNAMLGHLLSKGDFGIAATITLTLQLLETATDVAADRFVIQADSGSDRTLLGVAHTVQLIRAILIAGLLWLAAPLAAEFFHTPEAAWGFRAAALALLVKGFTHLDSKRLQKQLDNRAAMALEVVPQAGALLLTWPAVKFFPSYEAIVWLTLAQAILTVAMSQLIARQRWSLLWNADLLRRLLAFSWPIWLSAIPLMAVYQGDRMIIGRYLGVEQLAGYTAAFLITMVPGLIASRVSFSLVLPMLSQVKEASQGGQFVARLALLSEATALVIGLYAAFFLMAGGEIVALTFGPNYAGLHAVTAALAVMWSARMLQAVPGTALMALGRTDIFPIAGCIRGAALLPAFALALDGAGLAWVAAAGAAGEFVSFLYVARTLSVARPGSLPPMLHSAAVLAITIAAASLAGQVFAAGAGPLTRLTQVGFGLSCAALACLPLLPQLRRAALTYLTNRRIIYGPPSPGT